MKMLNVHHKVTSKAPNCYDHTLLGPKRERWLMTKVFKSKTENQEPEDLTFTAGILYFKISLRQIVLYVNNIYLTILILK